jgi:hypothetical protein
VLLHPTGVVESTRRVMHPVQIAFDTHGELTETHSETHLHPDDC